MAIQQRMQFVRWQLGWMVAAILFLSLTGTLSYDLFVLLSILGLIVVTEVTTLITVSPAWQSRLQWLRGIALVVFVALAGWRLWVILPPEVLP